ncbi:MAG: ATP-grasp fold amidoligase family protein [Anderseniella sp.]
MTELRVAWYRQCAKGGIWVSGWLDRLIVKSASAAMFARHWRATIGFRRHMGRWPQLCPPVRHNDKFFWRKVFDHNPLFQVFCDKLACKEWVRECCPEVLIPATLWQGTSARDIPDDLLLRPAFIKANNGSSYNIRIDGNTVDRKAIENSFSRWLSRPYGQGNAEWGYKHVPRTVFVEEIVSTPGGTAPVMTNVYTAGGKPVAIFCISGWKDGDRRGSFFNLDGSRVSQQPDDLSRLPDDWRPPSNLDKVVEYSRILVRDTDQIRSDFLCQDGKIWFSEMTPYPLSGLGSFDSLGEELQIYGNWDLRQSWFLRTRHSGWKRIYADALRRML